jgi:hypothetical protein
MDGSTAIFDFSGAMRQLCRDIVGRLPELAHIDVDRVAFNLIRTRKAVAHGIHASLTPLRFEGGAVEKIVRGVSWRVTPVCDFSGKEFLYLLSFYLPRFQNASFEEKLSTVFHELWHIGPEFNGDLRRHNGACYAHGSSRKQYDALMNRLGQQWLALGPPCHVYDFLTLSFADLVTEHGPVVGQHWSSPKIVRV